MAMTTATATQVLTDHEPAASEGESESEVHLLDLDGGDRRTLCNMRAWQAYEPSRRWIHAVTQARAQHVTCEACRRAAGLST